MSNIQSRIDKSISEYSVALMSNTKWRTVFELLAELQLSFSIAFVREHSFGLSQKLESRYIEKDSISDGGLVCGPLRFKEIYSLRIERYENLKNAKTGATEPSDIKSGLLVSNLEKSGLFPINISKEHIYLNGYQK